MLRLLSVVIGKKVAVALALTVPPTQRPVLRPGPIATSHRELPLWSIPV